MMMMIIIVIAITVYCRIATDCVLTCIMWFCYFIWYAMNSTIIRYDISYYTMLYYVILCYNTSYHIMLYYIRFYMYYRIVFQCIYYII